MEEFKVFNFVFSDSQTSEHLLLEFQGNIQHTVEKKFYFMFLGHLNTLDKETYTFNIGNHQLVGKRMNLKNPILVCQTNSICNEVKILSTIKSKICFFNRPTPILTSQKNNN